MRKKVVFIFFILALLASYNVDAQCAMCKAVAESNSGAGGSVANGLNSGILYLMVFPYLMMGVVAFLWYRHNKKTRTPQS
ncbi:hypothetical protein [Phaeocystidibacter luteus]|uniref:Uncharacterized protein n=1 Tax=Phaeocystidibacter luteus TaxID=911197 RepID=A0A6N6RJI3_9FLAO|nr:hypothetical protein [Phaeocystidibacter luteus]KAB2813771.1 hypothetical protein F8C67_06325 [Phaeocystidibacter luteus]